MARIAKSDFRHIWKISSKPRSSACRYFPPQSVRPIRNNFFSDEWYAFMKQTFDSWMKDLRVWIAIIIIRKCCDWFRVPVVIRGDQNSSVFQSVPCNDRSDHATRAALSDESHKVVDILDLSHGFSSFFKLKKKQLPLNGNFRLWYSNNFVKFAAQFLKLLTYNLPHTII